MKKSNKGLLLSVLGLPLLLNSCSPAKQDANAGSGSDSAAVISTDTMSAEKIQAIDFKFSTAYVNLPSPFEVVHDLYRYQAPFRKELLNPIDNASKYAKSFRKEINFGIYGVDLAYINFYGQNQGTADYYNVVQGLARDMNIETVFGNYADRYKNNADRQDSLVSIVDNMYTDVDAYLRKSERYTVASNVMAGSIIEVCYLSLNLLKDMPRTEANTAFFEKVHNENTGIFHLIKLFEEYPDKDSKALLAALKTYKTGYDNVIKSPADMNPDNIDKAIALAGTLRSGLIR